MRKMIAQCFNVKSIVTILLCSVFVVMTFTHTISGNQFLNVFMMVISFYYGVQCEKSFCRTNGN